MSEQARTMDEATITAIREKMAREINEPWPAERLVVALEWVLQPFDDDLNTEEAQSFNM